MTIAVYKFTDMTGQRKPSGNVALLSSAVTQGAEIWLIQALKSAGRGEWFQVLDRGGLDNLVKERQIIRSTRTTYEGKEAKKLSKINLFLKSTFVKKFFSLNKSGISIFVTSSFKRALGGFLGSLFCKR